MGKTATTSRRTLHIFGAFSRGGAETWLLQSLAHRAGSAWGADICLLSGDEGACVPAARALGLRVLRCPYRPGATFPSRFLHLLRRERYDVVHSHVLLFSGAIGAIARRAGTPVRAAHAHNSSDGRANNAGRSLYRALMRRMIAQHANLVVACSRAAAGAFDGSDAQILPYGIDLAPFTTRHASLKASFGIPEQAMVLAMVGRLVPQKNHRFLLEAFAGALRQGADLHLALVGDGELRSELKRRIAELGVEGRAHLLGLRDDVPSLLTGLCDAFVMPSLYEGLPVALLEAQAAGLPCLIADGISPEAIVLLELVERLALDTGAWAGKLVELRQRPRYDLRAAAGRMREAGFDAAESWPRLIGLYEAALGAQPKARAA